MDRLELDDRFEHHPPTSNMVSSAHENIRLACRMLARTIEELCPDGREKSTAVTRVEEAMFWANAAVARTQQTGEKA
jgi:hypothetical protein